MQGTLIHCIAQKGVVFISLLSSCSQVMSGCSLLDCNSPLVPVSFAHLFYFQAWMYSRTTLPLPEHWQKCPLIISQIIPSALCVHQGKPWYVKTSEQLAKHGLLINLTTIISMLPGTWLSGPILSALFAYDCQPLQTGHTVLFLYRVRKSSEETLQSWAYTRLWLFK